ncbi:MAG TPA: efflux RND transporter periplasmic adaptor subunit [Spongiibacteraceae bacterium]|nr:efflux RND transporter periplasmic adaptor subunit [Spongiibacteraceae bacterium]
MAQQNLNKRLLMMGLFLILLFGGLFGFDLFRKVQMGKAFAAYRPAPVPVTAIRAEIGAVPRALQAIGTLEAVRQVTIAPEVDGRITELHLLPGATVKAGQPLLQLNDGPERGDLQRLRAQARLAQINIDRSKQLLNLAVSQGELDTQQATLDAIAGDIARTEALIAQKLIRAPFSGALGVQRVHEGQYVKQGEALVTLTDLHTLFLNLTLPEQTHSQLSIGQTVQFYVDALPQQQFSAKIIAIEPQIGAESRAIKLQAQLDNPKNLLAPGMFARAALQLAPEANVLSVPETAIDFSIHGDSVFVLRKQKTEQGEALVATRALVQTDGRSGDRVIVRSGLQAGDLVATTGQIKLHDGAPVQIVDNTTLEAAAKKMQGRPE